MTAVPAVDLDFLPPQNTRVRAVAPWIQHPPIGTRETVKFVVIYDGIEMKGPTKGSKMMASIRKNIARTYNMSRPTVVARASPPKKNKPNLSNAVARMKASAAKLKANRVSTKRA